MACKFDSNVKYDDDDDISITLLSSFPSFAKGREDEEDDSLALYAKHHIGDGTVCSSFSVGWPLLSVFLGELLRVLHELLLVLDVLLGQVGPQGVVGLGLVDQGNEGLDHLEK